MAHRNGKQEALVLCLVNVACGVPTIAAVLLLAACGGASTSLLTPQSSTSPSASAPTFGLAPTVSPSQSAPSGGLSSTSIHPESVTFVSADIGWVLGLSLCGKAACLRLAKAAGAGG